MAQVTHQKWANRLFFPGLGIRSFAYHSFVISLKSNEQLQAIRSDPSRQMSDCEQIVQVAHIKRATVSEMLSSLITNEQPWAIPSGPSPKMSEWAICSTIFGKKKLM